MEKEELLKAVETGIKDARTQWEEKAKKEKDALELQIKAIQDGKESSAKEVKALQDQLDELDIKLQDAQKAPKSPESFATILGKALDEKKDEFSQLSGNSGNKKKVDTSLELKAVGDITFTNFGTGAYDAVTTEVRPTLYQSPFSPLWLRNVLPNGSTNSAAIQYLRANGGEGAATVWVDATTPTDKPQIDFDWELVTDTVDWIAGIARVHRGMLDDVAWLRSYLSQQMIFGPQGLFVAENGLITSAFDANSVAYDGSNTIIIEAIYDAAFGQLRDFYFSPSHILMNHRDVVNELMLNKASGSGEYDLPVGTVLIVDGQLTVGGVPVIGVPNIPQGSFYVIDNRQTQFVSRMSPEVRFFEEDRDNVIKNLVTVRAEERAAVLIFNENAIVKGTIGS